MQDLPENIVTLLFVEDDPDVRGCLTVALEFEGYDVSTAIDGLHALELIGKNDFDVILSDNIMPRLTGLELYDILKRDRPDIPFILFTAYSGDVTIPPDLEWIEKPARPGYIIDTIRRVLSDCRCRWDDYR